MVTPEKAQNISGVVEEDSSPSISSTEMCENWGKELPIDYKELERLESKALTDFF